MALAGWDGPSRLAAITAPVVVVVGEHEDGAARAAAEGLAAAVGNGRVVELRGAGRRGVVELPEALAALVTAARAEDVPSV